MRGPARKERPQILGIVGSNILDRFWHRIVIVVGSLGLIAASSLFSLSWSPAAFAGAIFPARASWCSDHGSSIVAWSGTTPNLPLCGPGPAYGGTWGYVDLPGPYGAGGYYNATPGFQCVELAERFLSVADGLAPVLANGSNLAAAYHAAYRSTSLVVNGTPAAVGHPPRPGGVISFSLVPSFYDPTDGHVAIVVSTNVDARTGNGTVEIAQENVAPGDFRRSLDLLDWRLVDPSEPPNAEFQYPYAEWLNVSPRGGATSSTESARVLMSPMVWHSRTSLAAEMKLRPSAHFRRARRPQLLQPAIGPLLTARLIEGRRALSSSTANR